MQLTSEEWGNWYSDPVTQAFVQSLRDSVVDSQNEWSHHGFTDFDDIRKSDRLNLYALAGIEMLRKIIDRVEECRPQQKEG